MLLLDAINQIIRASAQKQVNNINDENATVAQNVLRRERRKVLSTGYHFNSDTITLQVDQDGKVPLDRTFLKVRFTGNDNLSFRDEETQRYVWDRDTDDWYTSDVSGVDVVFDIDDFSLLPEQFAQWITAKAALEHWYDCNQQGDNARLIRNVREQSALAINSLPSRDVHTGVAIHSGSPWVSLGD